MDRETGSDRMITVDAADPAEAAASASSSGMLIESCVENPVPRAKPAYPLRDREAAMPATFTPGPFPAAEPSVSPPDLRAVGSPTDVARKEGGWLTRDERAMHLFLLFAGWFTVLGNLLGAILTDVSESAFRRFQDDNAIGAAANASERLNRLLERQHYEQWIVIGSVMIATAVVLRTRAAIRRSRIR